jgi:hypothetical protein
MVKGSNYGLIPSEAFKPITVNTANGIAKHALIHIYSNHNTTSIIMPYSGGTNTQAKARLPVPYTVELDVYKHVNVVPR